MIFRRLLPVLLLSAPPAAAETVLSPEAFNTAEPVILQSRFAIGSGWSLAGRAAPNFPVAGSPAGRAASDSRSSAGVAVALAAGGLGPRHGSGCFAELLFRRRSVSFAAPTGPAALGQLNSAALLFSPQLGVRLPIGEEGGVRPFVEFGGGAAWSWLDASDPNLFPAPSAGSSRAFKRVSGLAWKAGAGIDLHWRPDFGVAVSAAYLGVRPVIPVEDSKTGVELARVDFGDAGWTWLVGLAYGY